jgi:hypothetical protein
LTNVKAAEIGLYTISDTTHHHLRDSKWYLDQAANMSMKIPVIGFSVGILVAAFIGAVQARDDGRYSLSPLKPWFGSLRSGKGPCCSGRAGRSSGPSRDLSEPPFAASCRAV